MRPTFICGDIHLHNFRMFAKPTDTPGINSRAQLILDAMELLAERIEACNGRLIQLGDLFDVSRPAPILIQRMEDFARRTKMGYLVGNHDRGVCAVDGATSPITNFSSCSEIKNFYPQAERGFFVRDFGDGIIGIDWTPNDITAVARAVVAKLNPKVLLLHAGLDGHPRSGIPKNEESRLPDVLRTRLDLSVLSGHWHSHHVFGSKHTLAQVGAFCPVSFSDSGDSYGRVYRLDTNEWFEIKGPRFYQCAPSELSKYPRADNIFLRALETAEDKLDASLLVDGQIDVVPVGTRAASQAISIPSVDEAIRMLSRQANYESDFYTAEDLEKTAMSLWRQVNASG